MACLTAGLSKYWPFNHCEFNHSDERDRIVKDADIFVKKPKSRGVNQALKLYLDLRLEWLPVK